MATYHFPIVTGLTAAALAILCVILSLYVIAGRARYKVAIGDGGHHGLTQRIRIHANLIENAPIFLILLLLVELMGVHSMTVAWVGPAFVLFRIAHVVGLSVGAGANLWRGIGIMGSLVLQLLLALDLIATLLPYIGQW